MPTLATWMAPPCCRLPRLAAGFGSNKNVEPHYGARWCSAAGGGARAPRGSVRSRVVEGTVPWRGFIGSTPEGAGPEVSASWGLVIFPVPSVTGWSAKAIGVQSGSL